MKASWLLGQLRRQPLAHAPAAGHHDAPHRPRRLAGGAVHGRQDFRQVFPGRQYEDFITRLDQRAAIAAHKAIGFVGKAPVDGHDAQPHFGVVQPQLTNTQTHGRSPHAGPHRCQTGTAAGKFAHLQRLRVFGELADVAGQRGFGADDGVRAQAILA